MEQAQQPQRDKQLNLRGKRVLVMGLGVHGGGLGVTRFLVEQGADVTVTDLRTASQLQSSLAQLADLPVRYVLGEHHEADFRTTDIVIRNPGVPQESPLLQIARDAGAAIEMEMTLFFRLCPAPIIGITGTKGKTTTTTLTGAMLREQFPDTVVAGNLRVSALEQLPRITPRTPVVLELSSWQLEGLGDAHMSPQFAAFINISPDHLDRYPSMQAYIRAKANIFRYQQPDDTVVLPANDWQVASLAKGARSRVAWFADEYGPNVETLRQRSGGTPVAAWIKDCLFWQHGLESDVVVARSEVQVPGQHNLGNIAAATALAISYGVGNEQIRRAIQNFRGVPDRLELVADVDGVRYINDTTATTPTAATAAVLSFNAPTIVIAGGADKNLEFWRFAGALTKRAKAVVLLDGTATPQLQDALEQMLRRTDRRPTITAPQPSMQAALDAARNLAAPGDVVVLAPGCASFGMFRNEFDRGEQFRQIVQGWAGEQPSAAS
jgi:UDP-N-acetylmuramoylalanine--D-glutamate ligase